MRGRPPKSEYAIYKGDELICMGKASECADYLGVKLRTIWQYASPAHKRKRKSDNYKVAIKLDSVD